MTVDFNDASQKINGILARIAEKLRRDSGKVMQQAMLHTVRDHVAAIYPGSKHYDPGKVTEGVASGNEATVDIDIPGICRAWHSHTIVPRRARWLTIPIHRSAYGLKVSEYPEKLFRPKDRNILAKVENGSLVAVYALARRAFQPQDSRLMPTDETLADNMLARISAWLGSIRL